jgi:hypothetical protein
MRLSWLFSFRPGLILNDKSSWQESDGVILEKTIR